MSFRFLNQPVNRRAFVQTALQTTAGGLLLASCGITPAATEQPTLIYIGGVSSPFYQMIQTGTQQEARKQKVAFTVLYPPRWDAAEQSALVQVAIARGVQAIIIAPCDQQALIAPLRRAHDAGIKVITVDTVLGNGDYTQGTITWPISAIGSDNLEGGRLAGKAMTKLLKGRGKVYIQSTGPGTSATDLREQGFKSVVEAAGLQVLGTGFDYGDIAQAAQQTAALLARERNVAAIFGTGDFSAKGVMQALRQAGKIGQIKVVRFDASQEAVADLRAGAIDLIISQQPALMGSIAVQDALLALRGKTVRKQSTTTCVLIDRQQVNTQEAQAAIYQ